MRITLASLGSANQVSANVVGQLTKIVDFQVPQGQFFALDTKRPQVVRIAAQALTTARAISAGERTANAFDAAALADQPVQPLARYIPAWPSIDGYTFKVFIRFRDGGGTGPWTRATINAVNWATRVLTIALPANLANAAGASVAVAAGATIDIRVSYINTSGHLIWRRETPDNAQTIAARTAWDVDTYSLGVRDQLSAAGRVLFNTVVIWVPQQCNWRWYMNSPVAWDFDPILSATQIELNGMMEDMTKAHAAWIGQMQARGIASEYRNLYSLYMAQLMGLKEEAYPE